MLSQLCPRLCLGLIQRRMGTDLLITLKLCKYHETEIQSLKAAVILKTALKDKTVFDCSAIIIAGPLSGPLLNNSSWKPG